MVRKLSDLPFTMWSGGRIYYRRHGRLVRLPDPSDPGFLAAYEAAGERKRPSPASTTVEALVGSYSRSTRWEKLAPRTQADYRKVLIYLTDRLGSRDVSEITRPLIIEAMDANAHRTRFANYIPEILLGVLEHAIDIGWRKENPAKGIVKLKVPKSRRAPHIPWPDWAVEKWRSEASPIPRLIFELGVGSVQRPDDWTRFTWHDYDGDMLKITQQKTEAELYLPCTAQMKAALDGAPKRGITILTRQDGKPLAYRRMAEIMRQERIRLGCEAYDLHALRYRGVMELAWAGCDDEEIASYSGHATLKMVKKYAGKARQIMRAKAAREKRR